jgi:thiol-disulfide isomerase/thioredoxin
MKATYIYIALIVLVIGGLLAARHFSPGAGSNRVTEFDTFAQCLSDAGATFYGAFWCPHCQEQKALFDNSSTLPYIECSMPNGQTQTQICIDEAITGYPTWRFSDGSELNGVQQLSDLAEKTNCELTS